MSGNKIYNIKNPPIVVTNTIDASETMELKKGRTDYLTIIQYAVNNNLLKNTSKSYKPMLIPLGKLFSDSMRFSAAKFVSQAIVPTLCANTQLSLVGHLTGEPTINNLIVITQILIDLQNQGETILNFPNINI